MSRDGPTVNQKFMRLLKTKYNTTEAAGRKILDYGSDVLHVGHNAFREGLKVNPIDTSELAKCMAPKGDLEAVVGARAARSCCWETPSRSSSSLN